MNTLDLSSNITSRLWFCLFSLTKNFICNVKVVHSGLSLLLLIKVQILQEFKQKFSWIIKLQEYCASLQNRRNKEKNIFCINCSKASYSKIIWFPYLFCALRSNQHKTWSGTNKIYLNSEWFLLFIGTVMLTNCLIHKCTVNEQYPDHIKKQTVHGDQERQYHRKVWIKNPCKVKDFCSLITKKFTKIL